MTGVQTCALPILAEKDCTEVGLAEKSNPTAREEIKEMYYGGNTDEILGQRQKTG